MRRANLVPGGVVLGVGLGVHAFCFLFIDEGVSFQLLLLCHPCVSAALLPITIVMVLDLPSETVSPNKPFMLSIPMVVVSLQGNKKVTSIINKYKSWC